MKRFLLFTLVIGLFAVQANAAMWELTEVVAKGFTTYTNVGDAADNIGTLLIYDDPTTQIFGPPSGNYGSTGNIMSGAVGFVASFTDVSSDFDAVIAEVSYGGSPGLPAAPPLYDGITSYFQNDNDDNWTVDLFYSDASGIYFSGPVTLAPSGGSAYVTVPAPGGLGSLSLATITDMGFRISGVMDGLGGNPSSPDAFHVSLVPVPAAVLLGMLGLGVAGWKLRKFA